MTNALSMEVSTFQVETTAALVGVRAAMAALARAISPGVHRPADLQRALKVDYKLSWQIYNVINEVDLMAAARLVPGAPSLQRLLHAATNKGVSAEITDAVSHAIAEFNLVIERHAEDRVEFDLMASSIASAPAAAAAELVFRKGAYRNESHVWGVSADVVSGTAIVRRGADGATTDDCWLLNKRGFRRLRPDATLNVVACVTPKTNLSHGNVRFPLDQEAEERYGAHILPQFCSQPIPVFKTWLRPDGYTAVDVQSSQIGRQNAVSLALGQIVRGCPLSKGLNNEPRYVSDLRLATPARLLLSYLLVHRPSMGQIQPEVMAFRQTPGDDNATVAHSAQQIPIRDEIRYLGTGKAVWQSPDIENHDQMVQLALNEVGWNPGEFDVFCLHVEYPVLHSVVRMGFPVAVR